MTPVETPITDVSPVSVVTGLGSGGPLVYASVGIGPGAKERLARCLLASLAVLEPAWAPLSSRGPLVVQKGFLGRPFLVVGGQPGPAVSFSHDENCLWAALAATGRVGVDVALPQEFERPYPFSRAFGPAEFAWAVFQCHGNEAQAAALLWALKEAAVKALGLGFHFLDPREMEAVNPLAWQGGWQVRVRAGRDLAAWARPQGSGWLALARD